MRDRAVERAIPSWFWVCLGMIGLVFITMFSVIRLMPTGVYTDTLPPPPPAFTLPVGATGPQVPVSLIPSRGVAATASPSTTATKPPKSTAHRRKDVPPTRPRPNPPPASVTGRYQVLTSYSDSFIGQVLVTNTTSRLQPWQATVAFSPNVGAAVTSWVESQPQPNLRASGRTYTWKSTVPLAAHSTALLRFQFKRTGTGDWPVSCSVSNAPCK